VQETAAGGKGVGTALGHGGLLGWVSPVIFVTNGRFAHLLSPRA
jgi:hypothetical protein